MEGGYLSGLTIEVYNQYRLLTSRNYSHFYITLTSPNELCNVLNKLQSQAFQINTKVLSSRDKKSTPPPFAPLGYGYQTRSTKNQSLQSALPSQKPEAVA